MIGHVWFVPETAAAVVAVVAVAVFFMWFGAFSERQRRVRADALAQRLRRQR